MPDGCGDCRLKRGLFCGENGNSLHDYILFDDSSNNKPSWCPLRPLPQKFKPLEVVQYKDTVLLESEMRGWNLCIDEILGVSNETNEGTD